MEHRFQQLMFRPCLLDSMVASPLLDEGEILVPSHKTGDATAKVLLCITFVIIITGRFLGIRYTRSQSCGHAKRVGHQLAWHGAQRCLHCFTVFRCGNEFPMRPRCGGSSNIAWSSTTTVEISRPSKAIAPA